MVLEYQIIEKKLFLRNKEKFSKGMGFGLSLVKKIIDNYNGKIWAKIKYLVTLLGETILFF